MDAVKSFLDLMSSWLSTVLFTYNESQITAADVLVVPTVIIVGWILARWIAQIIVKRMYANNVTPDVIHLFKRLFMVLALVLIVITTLDLINIPLTAFAFVSGAIAIGVGFGAQNIINNFISGWILMWERPIRIGDFLEVENARGTVESINTRSTRFKRVDGVHLLIPNSKLLENTVVNWTLIDRLIRTSVRVGVAYGSDPRLCSELIMQAVKQQSEVLNEPKSVVIFDDFGDNALMFEAFFWIEAIVDRDLRMIRSNVRFSISDLFKEHGIVIAFPQRDIHIDGELLLKQDKES